MTNPPFSLNLGWNSPADMSHNPCSAGHTNRAGDVLSVPGGGS